VQIPALLYGTNAEVRKRCRKALIHVVREQQPLVETFEAEGMVDTTNHAGLFVLGGPGPLVSRYVHYHCYVPWWLLAAGSGGQTLGPIDPAAGEAVFAALLEKPWGVLCLWSRTNIVYWGGGDTDRYRRFLWAVLKYWDQLDEEGARYSGSVNTGESLWYATSVVRHVLACLGVPTQLFLQPNVAKVPLPPGGLAALVAHADRSLAGDLIDLAAAEAANRRHRKAKLPEAKESITGDVSTAIGTVFMSDRMKAAIQANDVEAVQHLVIAGDPIDAVDMEGEWTPLIWAAHQGHTDLVRFLLDHGANIEDRWTEGESPLMVAAMKGHLDTVRLLLDRGAHPNYVTDKGWDVVSFAEMSGDADVITTLKRVFRARG
jgi:Ankyrin repeats (3 copies)